METLALVLAILFVGEVYDLKGTAPHAPETLLLVALTFGSALAIGIYLAVTT